MRQPTRTTPPLFAAPLLAVALCMAGCAGYVADKIVTAPNAGRPLEQVIAGAPRPRLEGTVIDHERRIEVDDPPASLSVWIIDASNERVWKPDDHEPFRYGYPDTAEAEKRRVTEPRATVLILHAFRHHKARSVYLLWARVLSGNGYRVVLIDNRGHGGSTGDRVGFGVREARDVSKVIDALDAEGMVVGPVGVLGGSLGSATAIQLAAIDSRVEAVVAVAAYTDLEDVMRSFAKAYSGGLGGLLPRRTYRKYARTAADRAGVALADTDNVAAIRRAHAPVLFIHGDADRRVPLAQARLLLAAAPPGSTLLPVQGQNHNSIGSQSLEPMRSAMLAWFKEHLLDHAPDAARPAAGGDPG